MRRGKLIVSTLRTQFKSFVVIRKIRVIRVLLMALGFTRMQQIYADNSL